METIAPVIDFTRYISERTENFTGREWVFQTINDWLADPDGSRFFLLKGEPGSGKTAISAHLIQFAEGTVSPPDGLAHLHSHFLSAFHFCSVRDSRWINPRVFAESLAIQLAEHYPVYAKALAEKSGERAIRIEVQQRIEQGQGVGVLIKKLDVSGVSTEDAFDRVVREPLEGLLSEGLNGQVVILVDALDESLVSTLTPTIVSLLSQTCNLPSRVRFILTSRLEIDVLRPLQRSHPKELTLTSGQGLTQSLQDVKQYAQSALDRNPALENKLAPGLSRKTLLNAIQEKSGGNFLYVRYLLNMLRDQQEQINLTQLNTLPTGIDGIYLEFLERLVKSDAQSWENKYAPVLGALAVAQIPLNEAQLSDLTGQTELSTTIKRLHQLLNVDAALPASQRTYSIYHRSFIDFLLDEDRSEEYGRDEKREHMRLASWCEKGNLSSIWEDVKYSPGEQGRREYARKYYVTHLYRAQEWQRLFEVLDTIQYGQAKVHFDPSTRSFAQDVELGRQAAMWEGWTIEESIALLPYLWRFTLLRCSLTSQADLYPLDAFELLLLLGRETEALGLAELLMDPVKKSRVFLQIAEQHTMQPDWEAESIQMFLKVQEVVCTIKNIYERAKVLRDLASALAKEQQWERANEVISTIESSDEKARALRDLVVALEQAQHLERAKKVWDEAEAMIVTLETPKERSTGLREMAVALVQIHQLERAEAVISMIESSDEKAMALLDLGSTFAQDQQLAHANAVWTESESLIDTMENNSMKPFMLADLGVRLARAKLWEHVEVVIDKIESNYQKAEVLREWGSALAQDMQLERAYAVWTEAKVAIDTIEINDTRVWNLSALGRVMAQAQQWQRANAVWNEAKAIIDTIEINDEGSWMPGGTVVTGIVMSSSGGPGPFIGRLKTLREFGLAMVSAQQWERAEAIWTEAETIIDTPEMSKKRDEELRKLGKALISAKTWDRAEKVICKMAKGPEKAQTLSELGCALAKEQARERAEKLMAMAKTVISTIERSYVRVDALSGLGGALWKAQQPERAEAVWAEAEALIRPFEYFEIIRAMGYLGSELIQAKQWERVKRVIDAFSSQYRNILWIDTLKDLGSRLVLAQQWEQAQMVSNMLEGSDVRQENLSELGCAKVEILSELGCALAQAQQWEQAEAAWAESKAVINSIQSSDIKVKALSHLGDALAQAQQWEQAEAAWAESKAVINSIQSSYLKVKAQSHLVSALAQAQQWEQAEAAWAEEVATFDTMEPPFGDEAELQMYKNEAMNEAMNELVSALVLSQQWNRAKVVIGMLGSRVGKARLLLELGSALAQAQHWEQAISAWTEAEAVIYAIETSDFTYSLFKTELLSELGSALARAQQLEHAEVVIKSFEEGDETAKALYESKVLCELGNAFAKAGNYERLLRMLQHSWRQAETRDRCIEFLSLANGFIPLKPEIGTAFCEAFTWVDNFLKG